MPLALLDPADFIARLEADIDANHLTLPTLPEVALRVRDAVEGDNATARSIAEMVSQDSALSARLLQVANSPLYQGRTPVESVQMAVTRLGLRLVRSLVVSLAMKQIFQATSVALDRQFRRIWEDSLQVAAISRVLAGEAPAVEGEQAMLAGLVHNIGALPIMARVDELLGFSAEAELIGALLESHAPALGRRILAGWHFPPPLVEVPTGCLDLYRDPTPAADITDVVLVARLQHLAVRGHADGDWSGIPAFAKLGLEPEMLVVDMEGHAEQMAEVQAVLSI